MAEMTLKEGKILIMSQLHEAFESTLEANNVVHPTCSRKVLKQLLQHENTKVVGPHRKTIISLDMGLYQPAKKLQMARRDLDDLILRLDELHIVMAQLRTIEVFVESSRIDMCWTESECNNIASAIYLFNIIYTR